MRREEARALALGPFRVERQQQEEEAAREARTGPGEKPAGGGGSKVKLPRSRTVRAEDRRWVDLDGQRSLVSRRSGAEVVWASRVCHREGEHLPTARGVTAVLHGEQSAGCGRGRSEPKGVVSEWWETLRAHVR